MHNYHIEHISLLTQHGAHTAAHTLSRTLTRAVTYQRLLSNIITLQTHIWSRLLKNKFNMLYIDTLLYTHTITELLTLQDENRDSWDWVHAY